MVFASNNAFAKFTKVAVLFLALLMSREAGAASASFFVSVSASASPPASQWLLVTNNPFGYTVLTATNSPADAALAYSPEGILCGTAGDVLSVINPSNAAASGAVKLISAATGATAGGAALAFGEDGTLYLGDGYSLYTVNAANGACAAVGAFHTNNVTTKLTTAIYSLATAPDGTLFGGGFNLCAIDPATAAATVIGPICAYPWFVQAVGMAFGADGNLYMIGRDIYGVTGFYSVDTNNAAVTPLGTFPGQAASIVNSINPALPDITSQPQNAAVMPGGTATFSVSATAYPPLSPVWYFDGAPNTNATNFTLTIANVNATNAGSFFVVLTNTTAAITSSVVTLTVTNDIVATNSTFLASSASTGVEANSLLSLSTNPLAETVLGTFGTAMNCLSFDASNVLYGADNSTLYRIDTNSWSLVPLGPVETAGGGAAMALSGMAFSPGNILYGVSDNALYTIIVTNNLALATAVANFPDTSFVSSIAFGPRGAMYGGLFDLFKINPVSGALSTIGPIEGARGQISGDMKVGSDGYIYFGGGPDLNLYRLNPLTARATAVATFGSPLIGLAFYPAPFDSAPPSIMPPRTNAVAALGGTVTFYAAVSGAGPMTFQWRNPSGIVQDGSRFAGSATSALTISNLMESDAGSYRLAVTNAFGTASNVVATLTVGAGPMITVQPAASTRIVEGKTLTLNVTANGAGSPLLYQWMEENAIIAGATNKTLAVTANPAGGLTNLFYTVFVYNSFGAALSAPAEALILPNTEKPTVAVSVPAANARTGGNAISGAVSMDATQVLYWTTNINNGVTTVSGPASAALAGGSWSAAAALRPGTNILTVQSSNPYGNVSALVSRPFFYKVTTPLTLAAAGGSGTFVGKAALNGDTLPVNNAALNIGEGYSITAAPAANSIFVNWTGTAGIVAATTIHFIMESNLSLTANFATNQFIGLAGIYNGLFPNDIAATEETAGLISGLVLKTNGIYSGALTLEGVTYRLAGSFNAACQSSNYFPRASGALTVVMNLLTDSPPNQILGMVSSAGWSSDIHLIAEPAGPLPSAAYTMMLSAGTNFFGGYGYAAITNHSGSITFAGKLPDGAVFGPTMAISQAGNVPLYASLYGKTGILTGWLDFDTGEYGVQVPRGDLTWIRKAGTAAAGFTNSLTVEGSTWVAPPAGAPALPATEDGYSLNFSGGNLTAPLTFTVNNNLNKADGAITNSLTGSINPKTGLFTVTFGNGKGKATTAGTGALLQDSTNGYGIFPGATNSGAITLSP